jgi:hypothetical protein
LMHALVVEALAEVASGVGGLWRHAGVLDDEEEANEPEADLGMSTCAS